MIKSIEEPKQLTSLDVRRMMVKPILEQAHFPADGILFLEWDFKRLDRMNKGDVMLWASIGSATDCVMTRVLEDCHKERLELWKNASKVKMYRIEKRSFDWCVNEVVFNE